MVSQDCHKIVILNSKGGCGKTTLAVSLAAALAQRGLCPTLVDCDPQGFAMRWAEKRPQDRPPIHAIEGYGETAETGPLWEHLQPDSRVAIFDLPAAIPHNDLHDFTYIADTVLIPVMPSAIDIFTASRLVAELLLNAQLDRSVNKLAIVANRVRSTNRSYQQLQRFLGSLRIPMIASLRDTQSFVHAAANGLGITELAPHLVSQDVHQIEKILSWLERGEFGRSDSVISLEQERASLRPSQEHAAESA